VTVHHDDMDDSIKNASNDLTDNVAALPPPVSLVLSVSACWLTRPGSLQLLKNTATQEGLRQSWWRRSFRTRGVFRSLRG